MKPPDLSTSFDIGSDSIGWAVLRAKNGPHPEILGCGVVTFGSDDCLASKRRDYRRQRRHARSTRQRIERMEILVAHLGVVTADELKAKHRQAGGHPAPWLLAARVLAARTDEEKKKVRLSWTELWDVLRWYAHNRGYDGNQRWANVSEETLSSSEKEERKADTEKERNAVGLMQRYGKGTMAETVFADLFAEFRIANPLEVESLPFLQRRFKANQCAFPRSTVEGEVLRLLEMHRSKLQGCDDRFIRLLLAKKLAEEDRVFLTKVGIRLPTRFEGGLMFGQLVPRFENRIIAECAISGKKVPNKHCLEFFEFRWAMTLANIRVGFGDERYNGAGSLRPLNSDERGRIDARVRQFGFLKIEPDKPGRDGLVRAGKNELREIVLEETKCHRHNLDSLLLHPDARESLKLLPVKGDTGAFRTAWQCFDNPQYDKKGVYRDDSLRHRFTTQLLRGKKLTIRRIVEQLEQLRKSDTAVRLRAIAEREARGKKTKADPENTNALLDSEFYCDKLKGRARFCRELLAQAVQQIFHKISPVHPMEDGGGCLCQGTKERENRNQVFRSRLTAEQDVQSDVAARAKAEGKTGSRWKLWRANLREKLRRERTGFARRVGIAAETNNHLVRHRLEILERLQEHVIRDFAAGDKSRIARITVEVARDLQTMSGMTNKEKAKELSGKIKHHHDMAAWLAERLKDERDEKGRPFPISPGLIRKARIADDLGWECPYTGRTFEPANLVHRNFDTDHVIPRSKRLSDALEALVITSREVNAEKKNRTALQFIKEMSRPENAARRERLIVRTEAQFREFVGKLKTRGGHPDDIRRRKRRKELLLTESWEEKEFTPADLTKTRYITKLASRQLATAFMDLSEANRPPVISITGAVTAAFRDKSWKLLPLLGAANQEVNRLHEEKQKASAEGKDFNFKDAIRNVTHLHHALDAVSLGLITQLLVPAGDAGRAGLNGDLARLIHKGKLNAEERNQFEALRRQLGLPKFYRWAALRCDQPQDASPGDGGMLCIDELPECLKQQMREQLAKKRVVQHVPADMSGLKVEENTRGVRRVENGRVYLRQYKRDEKTGKLNRNQTDEAAGKLLGLQPSKGNGKLREVSGVRVISDNFGIAILDHAADGAGKFAIIPHHKVWHRIQELKVANQGKLPRILRIGTLIHVPKRVGRSDYRGIWMIRGAQINQKAGYLVDISAPDVIEYRVSGRDDCAQNVRLQSLYEAGLEVLAPLLTGVAITDFELTNVDDSTGVGSKGRSEVAAPKKVGI